MTTISVYDPFADVFPRLFKGIFDDAAAAAPARRRVAGFAVDVHEDESAYTLVGNLPGFSKDDIKIEIDGNQVNISAEPLVAVNTTEATSPSGIEAKTPSRPKVLRHERYAGAFSRGFSLPVEIDDAQSQAKYENGVLTLTLPKKPHVSARRVAVA
jgi:HSP20 family protein